MNVFGSKVSKRNNQASQEESQEETYAGLNMETYHDDHIYDVTALQFEETNYSIR